MESDRQWWDSDSLSHFDRLSRRNVSQATRRQECHENYITTAIRMDMSQYS